MTEKAVTLVQNISLERVTLTLPTGQIALQNVSIDFKDGGTFWIKASNGSGKSLLLRLLAGLEDPSSGRYLINGEDVKSRTFEEFSTVQRKVGFGFEYGGLISNKTVRQNLMLPFFYHRDLSADEAEARVRRYSGIFDLDSVSDLRPASCSGGRRKAACVARALITRPEILLLDHPTAGLDDHAKNALLSLIAEHQAIHGLNFLFIVSEDDRFMANLAHQTLTIHDRGLAA